MDLMWMLAGYAPQAVLEANFRPYSLYEREKLERLEADIVEVYCDCGAEEAARRFQERAKAIGRHAAHPLTSLSAELLAEYDRPIGIGTVISVDTRNPVDIDGLVQTIRRSWTGYHFDT